MSLDTLGRVTPLQYLYTRATNSNLAEETGIEPAYPFRSERLATSWNTVIRLFLYSLVRVVGFEPTCTRR